MSTPSDAPNSAAKAAPPQGAGADVHATDVFISFSSLNESEADTVCSMLERDGHSCWIAPRDILPGEDWGDAIVRGIRSAKVYVLILSRHANTSNQIKREVERAVSRGMPIIPFRIGNAPRRLYGLLPSTHWLDAFDPPLALALIKGAALRG